MPDEFDPNLPASQPLKVPTGPLLVRENCHMVGHRNPESLLQCNTYVRTFEREGSPVHVCVDPGSQFDYPVIESNINQLIGDLSELDSFSLNHQDPDVIGNAQYLCEANPTISVIVTEEVWRLAQHMLLKPHRIHFANAARSPVATIGNQHRWQLVPTPFCHFRGAMAFYDVELRTLFSGDLFGGLNLLGRVQLLAEEQDWAGIAQFHQIYMPGREAMRYAIRQIQALTPAVEVIAPQHGHVITGDLIPLFMERLYDLKVGQDLLAVELDDAYLEGYREVLLQLVNSAAVRLGYYEVLARLGSTEIQDGLEQMITISGEEIRLETNGYDAIVKALDRLTTGKVRQHADGLRSEIMRTCSELGVPIPPIGAGVFEGPMPDTMGPDRISTQSG